MTSPRQWKFLESFPTLVTTSYYFFLLSPYLSLPKKSQFFSLKDKLWNTFWNLFDASYHKLRTLYNTLSNFPGDMCPVGFPVWYICWNCFHGPSLCLPGQWVTRFSYPVIERLYPPWCLEKLVALYETECFRDNSGLRNNSATWLLRFSIKSSAIDIWYMVSLVSHLDWPGSLENLLSSCTLQQFQMKSSMNIGELKWLSLWQATAEYVRKLNLICSPHVWIEPTLERSLIIQVEEKPYCTSVFMA